MNFPRALLPLAAVPRCLQNFPILSTTATAVRAPGAETEETDEPPLPSELVGAEEGETRRPGLEISAVWSVRYATKCLTSSALSPRPTTSSAPTLAKLEDVEADIKCSNGLIKVRGGR